MKLAVPTLESFYTSYMIFNPEHTQQHTMQDSMIFHILIRFDPIRFDSLFPNVSMIITIIEDLNSSTPKISEYAAGN